MKLPCDCCTGVEVLTPSSTTNRAGLIALLYRVGTYATFFETMQARLSSAAYPALAKLKTREKDDTSIALLDAWSAVGDVLTFYQERIANEGYLRTATERRSILEQARLIGYRLRPGVEASVYLAYTIEKDSPPVTIPKGARANSIPAPGEQMQAFETSDDLNARVEWNAIKPRATRPQTAQSIIKNGLYLQGTSTNLKPNDPLLIDFAIFGMAPQTFRVFEVKPNDAAKYTLLTLRAWSGDLPLREAADALARRFADNALFNISKTATTTKALTNKVLNIVSEFAKESATASADEIAKLLQTRTLPALDDALKAARDKNFTAHIDWLGQMVVAFSGAQIFFSQLIEQNIATSHASFASRNGDEATGLSRLLDELQVPASVPPANTRQLTRSVQNTFRQNSELFPTLLSTVVPRLGGVLFQALGNAAVTRPSTITIYALRKTASPFGHNAPKDPPYDSAGHLPRQPWPEWTVENDEVDDVVFLDTAYDQVLVGSWAVVQSPWQTDATRLSALATTVTVAGTASRTAYGLNGKSTKLVFADNWRHWNESHVAGATGNTLDPPPFAQLRGASVYCQSEQLALAEAVIDDDVCDNDIEVDRLYDGLESGRWLVVSGERVDLTSTSGINASELVMLAGVTQSTQEVSTVDATGKVINIPLKGDKLHSILAFAKPLAYCYKRDTVTINANVANATHGETRNEVLGAGDASRKLQTFALKQSPQTFTSAPTVSGVESSLEVRVNEVTWHEAGSIADLTPNDRKFITHIDDDAKTFITFGNGERGARLPTGSENIRARYRNGLGKPGNVKAAQISLLATKPLGVKEVINPIRASGGADKENRDQARKNVPLAVMALDRLVSTPDYADFARTFAGVGKASAARLSDGLRELVHVTIAGADDIPIEKSSDLYRNLVEALHRYGDPYLPLRVEVRELLALVISANVKVSPDYRWEEVEPRIRATLLDRFGFENRELAQDVRASKVIATIQGVRGVQYVDLDLLRGIDEAELVAQLELLDRNSSTILPNVVVDATRVEVKTARFESGKIQRAQLAYIQPAVPDTLILNEVKS